MEYKRHVKREELPNQRRNILLVLLPVHGCHLAIQQYITKTTGMHRAVKHLTIMFQVGVPSKEGIYLFGRFAFFQHGHDTFNSGNPLLTLYPVVNVLHYTVGHPVKLDLAHHVEVDFYQHIVVVFANQGVCIRQISRLQQQSN